VNLEYFLLGGFFVHLLAMLVIEYRLSKIAKMVQKMVEDSSES